jgi:hypothetical protein
MQRTSLSDVARSMIDRAYEESQQAERLRAVEDLAAMTVDDDVLEPDELSRYLNNAYALTHVEV